MPAVGVVVAPPRGSQSRRCGFDQSGRPGAPLLARRIALPPGPPSGHTWCCGFEAQRNPRAKRLFTGGVNRDGRCTSAPLLEPAEREGNERPAWLFLYRSQDQSTRRYPLVRPALGHRGDLCRGAPTSRPRDPAAMVGSGDQPHNAAALLGLFSLVTLRASEALVQDGVTPRQGAGIANPNSPSAMLSPPSASASGHHRLSPTHRILATSPKSPAPC
jgi:hypothetical protein